MPIQGTLQNLGLVSDTQECKREVTELRNVGQLWQAADPSCVRLY